MVGMALAESIDAVFDGDSPRSTAHRAWCPAHRHDGVYRKRAERARVQALHVCVTAGRVRQAGSPHTGRSAVRVRVRERLGTSQCSVSSFVSVSVDGTGSGLQADLTIFAKGLLLC